MANWKTTEAIESLAAEIGDKVYIDIAKWHLYLNDAHLHTVLAEQFYPMLADNNLQEGQVLQILQNIPVKLGGGKREIPLAELIPMSWRSPPTPKHHLRTVRPNILQDKG